MAGNSLGDVVAALERQTELLGQVLGELQAQRQEIGQLREATSASGAASREAAEGRTAPSRPSPLGESGGGVGGLLAGVASRFPAAAAAAGTAAAGAALGQGVVSAAQGGDFAAGAAAGLVGAVARVPVLGELSGAAGRQRINQGIAGSQGVAALRDLATAGGEVSDALLDQVVGFEAQRAERTEAFNRRIGQRVEQESVGTAKQIGRGYLDYGPLQLGLLDNLLGFASGALSEGQRSLHMQINTNGIHTQK